MSAFLITDNIPHQTRPRSIFYLFCTHLTYHVCYRKLYLTSFSYPLSSTKQTTTTMTSKVYSRLQTPAFKENFSLVMLFGFVKYQSALVHTTRKDNWIVNDIWFQQLSDIALVSGYLCFPYIQSDNTDNTVIFFRYVYGWRKCREISTPTTGIWEVLSRLSSCENLYFLTPYNNNISMI